MARDALTNAMTFSEVNTTATRVPSFAAATQRMVTITTDSVATNLIAH